ncbi:DUF1565 domain-containing protein [Pendulispora rubella]|uniref:DUF1565 domain-containing protein n=1 Tax=Pendulispora rubella TaxID=2741070 RepID=A0ABZ2LD47_9BACT
MRAVTASSLIGFGASAVVCLVLAGCPPTFFEPCRGYECGLDDGGSEVGDDVRPDVPSTPNLPKIDGVVVEGNPSRTVRQGFGGDPTNGITVVHLTGERLDEVTEVKIGNGANTLKGDITEQTPRALSFKVKVVHGAPFGPQAVNIVTPSGSAASDPVFVISRVTASPSGSDSLERGSATAGTDVEPLRSMAKAITFAQAGDTVFLKDGTYDVKHGEIGKVATKVPVDVTVQGESREGTLLQWDDSSNAGGFVLAGNGRIESLGIIGYAGISAETGIVTIKNVRVAVEGVGLGISVGSFQAIAPPNIVLDSVDISGAIIAVDVLGSEGTITVSKSRIHGNRSGIDAQVSDATLIVTETEVDHNCPGSMSRIDGGIIVKGPAILTNVNIHDNQCAGITMDAELMGPLLITRGTFAANSPNSIYLRTPGKTTIRDSSFGYHQGDIIAIDSTADLDLGTPESPGGNRFTRCDNCDVISNLRPAQGVNPITVRGNTWNQGPDHNTPLPFGCWETDEPRGQTAPPRTWHIAAPGTCTPIKGNVMIN